EDGYSIGRGRQRDTEAEAELDAMEMRKQTRTGGKFYAEVRVEKVYGSPEQLPRPIRTQPDLRLPGVPRPGGGGNGIEEKLVGTWNGYETASDTNKVQFVFRAGGSVSAYDQLATWSGRWRSLGGSRIRIELTSPLAVNYDVTIDGNQ